MSEWCVVDYYDDPFNGDIVGRFATKTEAEKYATKYSIEECDGECDIEMKLYVVYNELTDIDALATNDIAEALMKSGELVDIGKDGEHCVLIYEDLDVAGYYEHNNIKFDKCYTIKEFIRIFSPLNYADDTHEHDVISKEVYHHLDDYEQIEVLHFVSDELLLDELNRRLAEYRKATKCITDIMDDMEIFV